MDELKYIIETKHLNKHLIIALFSIMIVLIIWSLYFFKGSDIYYIVIVIMILLSYLFRKMLIERPIEIQVNDKSLNLKYIFGKDKFIYFKDIETISLNSSNVFIMETKIRTNTWLYNPF